MINQQELSNQKLALLNGQIVLPDQIITDQAVIIDGKNIAGIAPLTELGSEITRLDVGGRIIAPGLIDIHTHGALGHNFNEATPAAFAAITGEQARRGVTSLLATTMTAPILELVNCLDFARRWMQGQHDGAQVVGVHIEGPYFAIEQAGAQDPANIRHPNDGTVKYLLDHAAVIKIMTYAPELPGALELTERLHSLGIVPAAGHSSARDTDVQAAMARGLRHIIHIWSAQSTTVRDGPWRKPGLLEASLTFDGLTVEMIADNKHLPPTLMKLAYKCLGPDRLCVISDATNGAGLPDGTRFQMGTLEYDVHDGVGMMLDRSAFAGSTTLLNQMIPVLTGPVGIPLAEAVRMVTLTPARVIGLDVTKGSLTAGKDADIAIFNEDFSAWRTMIGGRWVYYQQDNF